jgi:polar amino acid transport system substrate-binding protein
MNKLMSKTLLAIFPLLASFGMAQGTLRVAADVGLAPFVFTTAQGEVTGFSVDLFEAVADKLGYTDTEIVDVNFGSIFAGLFSERFDFIIAPTTITEERAQQMLFTEPYLPTGLSLLAKSNVGELADLNALEGEAVAVNSGSTADTWAGENAGTYGFEVQRYNKIADAIQAVATNRAYVAVGDTPVIRYTGTQNPTMGEVYFVDTESSFGYAFRNEDVNFRNQVEGVLECLKQDGTLAAIYEEWFGGAPDEGMAVTTIYPGYGAPGFPGYTEEAHELSCN